MRGVTKPIAGITFAGLALSALMGMLLGLGGYTLNYAGATSYLSSDPKACVSCHIMREQYDGWQKGAHHANATCNDCHLPHDFVGKYLGKMDHGYRHSKAFTLQDFHEPIRITPGDLTIVQQNCVRCHEGLVSEIVGHQDNVLQMINCVQCHSAAGHGPRQ